MQQKTVVFFPLGAFGHINPMLAIAGELRQRGYKSVLITMRPVPWATQVTDSGMDTDYCLEEGHEEDDHDFINLFGQTATSDPVEIMRNLYSEEGFVCKHTKEFAQHRDTICAKINSHQPDLLLVDQFLASCVRPRLTCPWVGLYSASPSGVYSAYSDKCVAEMGLKPEQMTPDLKVLERRAQEPVLRVMRSFWTEQEFAKQPIDTEMFAVSPHLNFYLGPRELGYENVPKFANILPDIWFRLEHTANSTDRQAFQVPGKLRNLPGKLIYFSLGTIVSGNPQTLNRLLAMLAKSAHRFVVSMGPNASQVQLAPNMWGDKFLDQKAILAQADMFITHGGHNSAIEAFYFGVPALIVMPGFADQFDIAQRVEDCGFGVRLNPYTCTEEQLLGAIERQLADESVGQQMKAIGARLRSLDYPAIAADKMEKLLEKGCTYVCTHD